MFPESDPLAPLSSRFPLSSAGGRIPISDAKPSGARPFGLRFAVDVRPREWGKHEKKETRTTKTKETRTTGDGKEQGGQPDTEEYIEITYE
ncbi:MAG: hypothetical protein ACRDUV_17750 [Pseudonocardiaceae bacterium]